MRWALASQGEGKPFEPVGFWIDTSWKRIRKDLAKRLDYAKLRVLFSDGEAGIEENLLSRRMRHQRCMWHGKHDFPYILYTEGLKKPDQKPFVDQLKAIAAMSMSKTQLEELKPKDRAQVRQLAQQTEQGFEALLKALEPYPKAKTYIENLVKPVTTFLRWWLQHGEALPLTTNAIESHFSQICNRVKRIGRRWSDRGLLNWLTVCFYKIFKPELWRLQWQNAPRKLVKIRLRSVEAPCQWSAAIT
jgi:transposase-like protein